MRFSVLAATMVLATSYLYASDSTRVKKPILFSFEIGHITNSAFGSEIDYLQEKNDEYNLGPVGIGNINSLIVNAHILGYLSKTLYFKSGLTYFTKGVNMTKTIYVYQDHVETSYLAVPILLGLTTNPLTSREPVSFSIETGMMANFAVNDKSLNKEWGIETKSPGLAFQAGVGFNYRVSKKVTLTLQYKYSVDLISSHTLSRFLNFTDPKYTYDYKFKSNAISLGVQIPIQ